MPQTTEIATGEDTVDENAHLVVRPISLDAGLHSEGREQQPPTEKQLRYINILGGSPSGVKTKTDASKLIDRLRSSKVYWPLDPIRLQQRGAKAGAESDGEWKTAHASLLASVRLDLQNYVDLNLAMLRGKLSDPIGPVGSCQSQGPKELVRRAEEEMKQLQLCHKWGQSPSRLSALEVDRSTSELDKESEPEAVEPKTNPGLADSSQDWTRWLWLVMIFTLFVTIESGVNIALLMDALPGGVLQAYLLAVLVSMINVGGFGICAGYFLFALRGKLRRLRPWLYSTAWVAWMLSAFAFNLVAGRHREAYARAVQHKIDNPTAQTPSHVDLLADVPFNLLGWEFETFLFSLLGMFLCALGFVKGFTFMKGRTNNGGTERQDGTKRETHTQDGSAYPATMTSSSSPHNRQLFDTFSSLPQRYQRRLTNLRDEVANWYRVLDQERRTVVNTVERLKMKENRQACIDSLEHAFIVAHNSNDPHKIDIQSVEENRLKKYAEPFAVTISDPLVLEEAAALISEWKESSQADFDERIAAAHEKISEIWGSYIPIVLRKAE